MAAKAAYGKNSRRRKLALLLPGHNEEIIIASTIRSARAAGLSVDDIYVVDDDSNDKTRRVALSELPKQNVLTVVRSGKARAVKKALDHFSIIKRYTWVHVADADSIFCPDYFRTYRKHLNIKQCSAAVGFVQSMRGNWIATYRSFSYTYGQHIFRRIQSWFGVIAILPGPVTCFKTDIIKSLDFATESFTEDFDLTLQIHRKRLGRIQFIPEAVNFTQDPRTLADFYKQTLRWQRGFFQGLRRYHIGLRPHMIDLSIGYQVSESVYYLVQLFLLVPLLLLLTGHAERFSAMVLLADLVIIFLLALFSAIVSRRPIILVTIFYFYFLKLVELAAFVQAFVEIMILRRFHTVPKGWETEDRRYEIPADNIESLQ